MEWKNFDQLESLKLLRETKPLDLKEALGSPAGAERVRTYHVPMAAGLDYNYAAKAVDEKILLALCRLAGEAQLIEKYRALYQGEMINTGEKRLVLHQLTRGQLGEDVIVDGVNKRDFYKKEQARIADFADRVPSTPSTPAPKPKAHSTT